MVGAKLTIAIKPKDQDMPGYVVMTIPNTDKATGTTIDDMSPKLEVDTAISSASSNWTTIVNRTTKSSTPNARVRRPLSGIAVKPGTVAYVQVVKASDGSPLSVFNEMGSVSLKNGDVPTDGKFANGGIPDPSHPDQPQDLLWTDWFLEGISEAREEKVQLTETFGKSILYVYGERPRFLQFHGHLMNTADFDWVTQFRENWETIFRATKLVENDAYLVLGWNDIVVTGYPFSMNIQQDSRDQNIAPFSFNFYVTSLTNLTMNNIGALQSARGKNFDNIIINRSSEFMNTGTYVDRELQAAKSPGLGEIVGGQRLAFANWYNSSFGKVLDATPAGFGGGVLQNLGIGSLGQILFSPDLRYISSASNAIEVLGAALNNAANDIAYQGVDALAGKTLGGINTINFLYGLIGHLYSTALNVASIVGGTKETATAAGTNRWLNLADNIATLGNPYALASYLGYAAASVSSTLFLATDRDKLTNTHYDVKLGLVSDGQNSAYGNAVSSKKSFATGAFGTQTMALSAQTMSGYSSAAPFGAPSMSPPPASLPGAATGSGANHPVVTTQAISAMKLEQQKKALAIQKSKQSVKHGAVTSVDNPKDVKDDGHP